MVHCVCYDLQRCAHLAILDQYGIRKWDTQFECFHYHCFSSVYRVVTCFFYVCGASA